jgi:hypothetical protein
MSKPQKVALLEMYVSKMNCHPDRSEAEWRDLLFALSSMSSRG